MEPTEYLDHVRSDGTALATTARLAPRAPVPSCPEWDMTDLVAHTAEVHRWVADIVRTSATERPRDEPEVPTEPAAVLVWYGDGLTDLLDVLEGADPDAPVWNWFDRKPAPTRFWHRRMAHETAVHRWDAQAAAGVPEPIDAALAVDGIDEFLSFVEVWLRRRPIEKLNGSLHLHATDTEGEWSLSLAADRLDHWREHTKADAAIRGPASDLFLWVANRIGADSPQLQVFGDRHIVDAWRAVKFE
ncbi:MAG TPA: maleylpyruvate isomerase family mycothiol-dependent enzyme [Acidimicrobiales bacterium]|nr:maleylpyruvate isomerase family mycothiol-dependent enzyme [Acidimicrobiales bacterium]